MTSVDPSQELIICPECGKTFTSIMSFRGHQGFHRKLGTYVCDICAEQGIESVFRLPQGLGAHTRAKHGIKPRYAKSRKQVTVGVEKSDLSEGIKMASNVIGSGLFLSEKPKLNGPDPIEKVIREAFAPLVARYQQLSTRQQELAAETQQVNHDLGELWKVIQSVSPEVESSLAPPVTGGVQVAFQKRISDQLHARMEEWLSTRRNSFTGSDVSRALAISGSTAGHLVSQFRDEGKLRLVGQRGRSKTYQSTVGAR